MNAASTVRNGRASLDDVGKRSYASTAHAAMRSAKTHVPTRGRSARRARFRGGSSSGMRRSGEDEWFSSLYKLKKRPRPRHPCLPSSIFLRIMAIELKSNPSAMPMTEYTPPMMAMREVMKE